MDGSAAPFFKLIKSVCKRRQAGYRKVLRIKRPITHAEGDKKITTRPFNGFKVTGEIDFDDSFIKTQKYTINVFADRFDKEISGAITFSRVPPTPNAGK